MVDVEMTKNEVIFAMADKAKEIYWMEKNVENDMKEIQNLEDRVTKTRKDIFSEGENLKMLTEKLFNFK